MHAKTWRYKHASHCGHCGEFVKPKMCDKYPMYRCPNCNRGVKLWSKRHSLREMEVVRY